MTILVIAEHWNQRLAPNTSKTISAAKKLGQTIHVLIAGMHIESLAKEISQREGVSKVLVAENVCYEHQLPENLSKLIKQIGSSYSHILTSASSFGKNLMPRIAALFDMSQLSDVIEICSEDTFIRPMYAGNIIATVQSHDLIKLMTIRASAFSETGTQQESAPIEKLDIVIANTQTQYLSREESQTSRPELGAARIIVSGGRALQSKENFALIEKLADCLGAAIGASRAAVDAGFVPNDYQVGQTGKIVAPELYIAVGISGAIQHLAGMKDSKVIVAINKDPDAAIFQVADYGLVGDLFEIIPEFIQSISQ